jgi:hypothetical protein
VLEYPFQRPQQPLQVLRFLKPSSEGTDPTPPWFEGEQRLNEEQRLAPQEAQRANAL